MTKVLNFLSIATLVAGFWCLIAPNKEKTEVLIMVGCFVASGFFMLITHLLSKGKDVELDESSKKAIEELKTTTQDTAERVKLFEDLNNSFKDKS